MGLLALLDHVVNFLAPALWLALGLTLASRLFIRNRAAAPAALAQVAILFIACSVVLLAGLVLFGRDGKMLTYGVLVLVSASLQRWLLRGTRG